MMGAGRGVRTTPLVIFSKFHSPAKPGIATPRQLSEHVVPDLLQRPPRFPARNSASWPWKKVGFSPGPPFIPPQEMDASGSEFGKRCRGGGWFRPTSIRDGSIPPDPSTTAT